MDREQTFRAVMLIVFLLLIPIGVYHRLKSQSTGERLDRRHEGPLMLATLRPLGLMHWGSVIAYVLNPSWMAWASLPLPAWLRWTGAALAPLGAGLLVWSRLLDGQNSYAGRVNPCRSSSDRGASETTCVSIAGRLAHL